MFAIATLTHAAEMMLPADNGCCTMTFPYCTRQPCINMAKTKTRLKILIKSNLLLCQHSLKFFTAIFFHQFFCFHVAEAHVNIIFPQNGIFTCESRMLRASLPSSGRPSICPSVTLVICIKTVQARITKSLLWAAPRFLIYHDKISCHWVQGSPLNDGVKEGYPLKKTSFCRYWLE